MEDSPKYLLIDGIIVAEGTEADLVNTAAQYDSDYEIADVDELEPEEVANWNLRYKQPE